MFHAMDAVLPKVKRLLDVVTSGKGVVVVKNNIEEPYAIEEFRDLLHTVCYDCEDLKGKVVLLEQQLGKFIVSISSPSN